MGMDLFARIGDIEGESSDDKHKGAIEVISWSWGVSREASAPRAGGGATRKPTFAGFTITHLFDKASPSLMKACASGEHIKEATVTARKAGGGQQDYLIIKMKEVIVTSVVPSGSRDQAATTESVSLQFASVEVEYRAQKPDGSLGETTHFTYDIKANRGG